jgi:hypothetical protein
MGAGIDFSDTVVGRTDCAIEADELSINADSAALIRLATYKPHKTIREEADKTILLLMCVGDWFGFSNP